MRPSTPIIRRLASNVGWLFLERGVSLAVAIGVGLYFVRYLGPDNFGAYSYALGLYGLFFTASKVGINALVVDETVRSKSMQSRILGSAFALRIVASIVCIVLLNVTAYFLGDAQFSRQITLVFSAAMLFGPFESIVHWFEATVQMRAVAVARSVTTIAIGLTRLALILAECSLFWFVWLVPLEAALTSVFFVVAYRTQGLTIADWRIDPALIRKFVREGMPLLLSSLAVITYMRIDVVMLEKMTTSREVGFYAAAVRISEIFYFVSVILSGVFFPYLIKAKERGEHFFRQTFQVVCDGIAWIALAIALPVSICATPLIALAYGKEYLPSAQILVVHVWAGVFVFIETVRIRWLVIHKLTVFQFWTTALGAVTNVGLNIYLIPRYQGYGAAWATTISYALAVVLSCFLYRRTREIGVVLVKSILAPLRIPETLRAFALVKTAVDAPVGSAVKAPTEVM
jgi:O-antigen/teichoic acid export membrane protein